MTANRVKTEERASMWDFLSMSASARSHITAKTAKGVGFGFELCAHFCANAGRYFINIAGAAKKYSRVFFSKCLECYSEVVCTTAIHTQQFYRYLIGLQIFKVISITLMSRGDFNVHENAQAT